MGLLLTESSGFNLLSITGALTTLGSVCSQPRHPKPPQEQLLCC